MILCDEWNYYLQDFGLIALPKKEYSYDFIKELNQSLAHEYYGILEWANDHNIIFMVGYKYENDLVLMWMIPIDATSKELLEPEIELSLNVLDLANSWELVLEQSLEILDQYYSVE